MPKGGSEMPSDENSRSQETGSPGVRYYKSRYFLNPAVYVQEEGQWRSYGPGGIIRQSAGTISETVMSQIEEIGQSEAEELIRVRLAEAEKLEAQTAERDQAKEDVARGPSGLGGWLVLPIIGLFLTLVFAVIWMSRDALPTLQGDIWPQIPTSGRSTITFEVFANLVFIVVPIVLLVLLFLKRRLLPRLIVGFYAFIFLAVLADSIAIFLIGPQLIPDAGLREEAGWSGSAIAGDIVRAVIMCAIWIPYFLFSKRVKNTFVNPPIPEPLPQPIAPFPQPLPPMAVETVAAATPRVSPTTRSRRTRRWVLGTCLIVVLAVLAVLVWKCAAPSNQVGEPSPGPNLTKTYTDPDYGFTLEYPAGWVVQEDDGVDPTSEGSPLSAVGVLDPASWTGGYMLDWVWVRVYDVGYVVDDSALTEIGAGLKTSVSDLVDAEPPPEIVVPVTGSTVGGLRGYTARVTDAFEGTPLTVTSYWVFDGTMEYDLLVQAESATWEEDQATFRAIIASFKPGSKN
jgi:hypothetical protein